ncbi:unnamed protein product [Haemonchus placei]|uniref:Uncharacterized protein n=2 Tax=Haemonchus TaxID=6288 RepID=A0A0N4WBG3_HAEPC|nr:unnamed protein product [Haemonchus placei]
MAYKLELLFFVYQWQYRRTGMGAQSSGGTPAAMELCSAENVVVVAESFTERLMGLILYPHKEELRVMTRETKKGYIPYRSGGYGAYHEKRQYDLSPRSIGSAADYSSGGSEQSSPASSFERNADEILLMTYHSRKTVGTSPRRNRDNWIRY